MKEHIDGSEISAFLDGAIGMEDRARVDAHLSSCSSCRFELESQRHLKLVVSSAPRRTMPADLVLALEKRMVSGGSWLRALNQPLVWVPAGATAIALVIGLWMRQARPLDELPLEPLLAAHTRYSAEALVSEDNLVASNYSDQMNSIYAESPEIELQ